MNKSLLEMKIKYLENQLSKVCKDVERYRWLRKKHNGKDDTWYVGAADGYRGLSDGIDRAMKRGE